MNHLGTRAVLVAATVLLARRTYLRWGATSTEIHGPLTGDQLLPDADLTATRAVTIRAPAAQVWPWLAQLGQGRGGFYSYDRLENVVGCNIHNADHIVPEWQPIEVGNEVRLHPDLALVVAQIDRPHAVVLRGGVPMGTAPPPYDFTWAFVLREYSDGTSRLIVRERYSYVHWWSLLIVEPVELVSAIMSQRMLRGIRDRAEMQALQFPSPQPGPDGTGPGPNEA
ncbi:SRPBCC family protein [Dermatophilaceae bacterium Sec6.4]